MFIVGGVDVPIDCFISPRIEVELAVILDRPSKGPNVTRFDVLSATGNVSPAIEIVDARIEQFDRDNQAPRKVFDALSDSAANGLAWLGSISFRFV